MKKKTTIAPYNFFVTQYWMISVLKLKGLKLRIYSIIYGFSQGGEGEYNGSIGYLSKFTGACYKSVWTALNELEKEDLIEKESVNRITGASNVYRVKITEDLARRISLGEWQGGM